MHVAIREVRKCVLYGEVLMIRCRCEAYHHGLTLCTCLGQGEATVACPQGRCEGWWLYRLAAAVDLMLALKRVCQNQSVWSVERRVVKSCIPLVQSCR